MLFSLLLKKALPFTLTFVVGTALGGLTWLFGGSGKQTTETVLVTRTYDFKRGCDSSRRRHKLVAESKPLTILDVPDAPGYLGTGMKSVRVNVTFGADGKVQKVRHLQPLLPGVTLEKVERAARQIEFTPETLNGVPVTVEKDVEIRLIRD